MTNNFENEVLEQLSDEDFKFLVRSAPLASVDVCVLVGEKLLLGKRKREPLREKWFTPGGCVRKGERWQDAVVRVSRSELGVQINPYDLVGMGSWDQFYDHSVCGDKVPTHYVTRAHALFLREYPDINLDEQHSEFRWVALAEISSGAEFSVYLKDYAKWFESRKASRGFSHNK